MASLSGIFGFIREAIHSAWTWVQTAVEYTRMTHEEPTRRIADLFQSYKEVADTGLSWKNFKSSDPLPESLFTHVDWNLKSTYAYRVKMTIKYADGYIEEGVYKTIESNRRLSMDELHYHIGGMIEDLYTGEQIEGWDIDDLDLLALPIEYP